MKQSNFEYQQRWAIAQGASFPDAVTLPESLADFLQCAAETSGNIRYLQQDGTEIIESYRELNQIATAIACGLTDQGVDHSDFVIIQASNPADFVRGFWGVVFCGGIPVPISAQVSSLAAAETLLNPAAIITDHSYSSEKQFSVQQLQNCGKNVSVSAIAPPASKLNDLALLLLTSGSTGSPKGVMLTQENLRVSAYGMAQKNNFQDDEITLNWMPLEHVASLVMFHLTPMYLGCSQIQVANELVLKSPLTWLDLIDAYRVTATWAPNFAYGLVNDQADAIAQRQWDLSCLRWMGNGAEAVISQTTRRFLQRLIPYGLGEKVISPGYGMSETASGIVHSHAFSLDTTSDDDSWVEVGTPIPGVAVRIADDADQVVTEGAIGQLQVKGLTVMAGYYQRPDLNDMMFTTDGWFKTGDLGFIENGRLTITGRQKDVIVLNGINYYSHEIEKIVENLEEIAVSFTAACAVKGSDETTDQLAIFFHPLTARKIFLIRKIRTAIIKEIGISPAYIIPVEPEEIPKTPLGKIQHNVLVERFANGEFQEHIQEITEALEAERKQKHQRPQTELELQIAEIWKSVLGVTTVGSDDNFFELGGTSLKLMQVLNQIQSQITSAIRAVDLFTYPTIATLASYLSQSEASLETTAKASLRPRSQKPEPNDIAIIGMAGRFPGAENLDAFWRNLCQGKEAITFFDEEELLNCNLDPSLIRNPNYVKASPILENVEYFDADFFGYSPKEAELLDPQHRLLLECAWESLETAGYNPLTYPGLIGLYAGASMNTYLLNQVYPQRHHLDANDSLDVFTLSSLGGFQTTVANDKDYLTTRVSYKLNLLGPSVNVQTACSTSLVAIHLAAQSILQGECDLALAGGVSVEIPQKTGYLYQEGMILSPDGHCRAFDAQGQGTLFGSGVGLVVLKSWEAAIADGDFIYAKIKGSAVGNDGGQKVGYFAPRSEGQAMVMTEALARANVSPESLSYVEAHGTGTPLGDPIEITGLTQAFRLSTAARQFCSIGSVKTNVGHLNSASGVVGLIKTVLALYYRQIPASLHFKQPNPQIDFANSPFYVNTELTPWLKQDTPRRAGVNALGIGGTNAHVILEEADSPQKEPSALPETKIFTVSARSESALLELLRRYLKFLEDSEDSSLADICFTASVGRSHFSYRLAYVVSSISQLQQALRKSLREQKISSASPLAAIAFIFTGKPLPALKQAQELFDTYPEFQSAFNHCASILEEMDISLLELLRSENSITADQEVLIFTVEYAIAQLWINWGIQPSAVFGSGVGEYVAASLAGVFSLEDALRLVVARSQPNTFDQIVQTVTYSQPAFTIVASVTGDAIATPEYWQQPEQQSVTEGIKTLEASGYQTFLECGSPLAFNATESQCWLRSLSSQDSATLPMLNSLAILYQQGHTVNWDNFYARREQRRIPLPTYPFERQRYWLERDLTLKPSQTSGHPLLGELISTPLKQKLFQQTVSETSPQFLQDHQIQGKSIFPGAGYLEMALEAGSKVLASSSLQLSDVVMARSLPLLSSPHKLQTILTPETQGYHFEIYSSQEETDWTLHCEGKLIAEATPSPDSISISAKKQLLTHQYSATTHYQICEQMELDYSNQFQGVRQIWRQEKEALGEIFLSEEIKAELGSYHLPPPLLDSCLQVVLAALPNSDPCAVYLPVSLDRFLYHQPIPKQTSSLYSYVQLESSTDNNCSECKAEVWVMDPTGQVIVSISGLLTKRVSNYSASSPAWRNWLYERAWHSLPPEISSSKATWGSWLLIGNQGDDLSAIAQKWEAENISCVIFHISEQSFNQKQLENLLISREDWQGIIFFPAEKTTVGEAETIIPQNSQNICETALGLVQTIIKQFQEEFPPQLWLVTRGAQAVLATEALSIAQSPLWGMGRTIMLEHPELNCLCLDLDPNGDREQTLDDLTTELKVRVAATTSKDFQIAYREGNRYQSQLVQAPISPKLMPNSTRQLQISRRGLLDDLAWETIARKKPEAGEVEIQVEVAGLNFRDVLDALGVYPGQCQALGLECVGTIVAVGSGVSHLQIGEPVMAIAPGSFSQFVTVSSALVVSKPKSLTSQAAATIPVTFLSAYYALCQVAQLTERDRVLIHTAAGGVGQAAIQLAQQVGAEIFATASPQKWEFLKQQGIRQIYNSRTDNFAEQIKEDTNGEGVTVVLNTLSGETIPKSLSILATGGRFLEIGKIDIWSKEKVAQVRPDIAYHLIDLVAITNHHPQHIQSMFSRLAEEFATGKLSPLPVSSFKATEVVDAFRWMQQGNHIGKVVVTPPQPGISSEATYLITGGTGALGMELAQRLVAEGARYLVLLGRRLPSEEVQHAIAQLEKTGVTVRLLQADIGDFHALKKLLSPIILGSTSDLPPLKGVFHLAGTIDDGILQQQTESQLETVMRPKVAGAWHLHQLTRELELDQFVLFSSAASVLGSAGQGNYAGANAFLDAIAHWRHQQGLPALSINWAAWSGMGMANQQHNAITSLPPNVGLDILMTLLEEQTPQISVLPENPSQPVSSPTSIFEQVLNAEAEDRFTILYNYLRQQVATVLGMEATALNDPHCGFTDLGIDSLTSVELRNRLQSSLNCYLPTTLIYDYPTLIDLTNYLMSLISPSSPQSTSDSERDAVENLSEEEAEALLQQVLKETKE